MNKKVFLFALLFFSSVSFSNIARAADVYCYDNINVDININQDSSFNITEQQTYNLQGSFGYFYRDIELKKIDHISDVEVFDSDGNKLNKEDYKISHEPNKLSIRWDFPRQDFNGELKSWTIKYKVYGGLGFYKTWDELYWNGIFADRTVEVKRADISVFLPKEINKQEIGARLFIGKPGDNRESGNYQVADGKTIKFWGDNVQPGEYLTIVVGWPKGLVDKPIFYRNQIINIIILLASIAIPIIVFIRCYIVWQNKGRDPKIKKAIIAQYNPPKDIPVALLGVLMKQNADIKDVVATIVDLAIRGYLRIKEQERKWMWNKEYIFEKIKSSGDLLIFERNIMESIFGNEDIISSKDLKNKFYKKLPGINKEIHKEMTKSGFFGGNIQEIRKKYGLKYGIGLAIFIFFWIASIFLTGFLSLEFLIPYIVIFGGGVFASCVAGIIFAYFMPSLTAQGIEMKWQALGFREYLRVAEKFRIEAETLETFSKFLPYAMVLGVEKQWLNRFSDFNYREQDWYAPAMISGGRGGRNYNGFGDFSSSFSSFFSSISQTFSSPPSGSGAGGGGGGGGGGGAG